MTQRQAQWRSGRAWPGLVAAACLLSGCLIRQDDTLLEGEPEFRNRPPRIVESLVEPRERIIRDFGAGSCDITFSVAVEDADVGDPLVVYWYVDYNPQERGGPYRHYELAATDQPLRADRGTLTLSLASANNPLGQPGPHLVEALVTDASLVERVPQPRREVPLADGGILQDPGYVASYAWVVNTVQGDCR